MKTGIFDNLGKVSFNAARSSLELPKYVMKTKVISGFGFESKLDDFIKDKNVVDIQYSCTIHSGTGYIYDRALVIYKEVE